MAITDIANVVISLQTSGVSRQGFGTPLFAASHRSFEERVRAYNSLTAVAEDFDTSSAAYKAATAYFSNSPAPRQIKIGRREADVTLAFGTVETGKVYTVSVASGSDTVEATYTALALDTGAEVAAALKTAIDAVLTGVVTTTVAGLTLELSSTAGDAFTVTPVLNVTQSFTTTETAAALLAAITEEDDDFYFFSADDHTASFVTAVAADIEARKKIYFFSTSAVESYGAIANPIAANDVLALVQASGYFRTAGMYAHNDTDFPECAYVGYNAPFLAGSVVWTNLRVALPFALNADGKQLTATQQNQVSARNAAFVRKEGGLNILRGGKVAGDERIENIRGRDSLESDMKANLTNLLINQQGGKLPYTNAGLNSVRSVINSTLDIYVARTFINPNYVVTIPDARDIDVSKKQAQLLDDATFRAELSGAITLIDIFGTLALEL